MHVLDDTDQSNYVLRLSEDALKPANIVAGRCFLCGGDATKGKGEHVIPRWLQKRYGLGYRTLGLLNGSSIQYRNLRVPACVKCNTSILGRTETYISGLTGGDLSSWTPTHSFEVGRWLSKVLIGLLTKQARLLFDRSDPSRGTIFPAEELDEFFLLHLLVQSWRKKFSFNTLHTIHPFTLYVYGIEGDENYEEFDFSTNLKGKSICLRFGGLGFAFVGDGGLQHHASDLGPFDLAFQKLHPVQFDELSARIHYRSMLRDATHSYINSETLTDFRFEQVSVVPYESEKLEGGADRVFGSWSNTEFAKALEAYQVPNWRYLLNEDGEAVYTRLVDISGKK